MPVLDVTGTMTSWRRAERERADDLEDYLAARDGLPASGCRENYDTLGCIMLKIIQIIPN